MLPRLVQIHNSKYCVFIYGYSSVYSCILWNCTCLGSLGERLYSCRQTLGTRQCLGAVLSHLMHCYAFAEAGACLMVTIWTFSKAVVRTLR